MFAPKYRRKDIYGKIESNIVHILSEMCKRKGIEIIVAEVYKDYIHMFVRIPSKYSVSEIMGYLKGKSSLMVFGKYTNLNINMETDIFGTEVITSIPWENAKKSKSITETS